MPEESNFQPYFYRIPMNLIYTFFATTAILLTCSSVALADNDIHSHGTQEQEVKAPRVFLDKNPRIVKYQLKRLDNTRLLLVDRKDDNKKYLLVHQEILMRDGMAKGDRDSAIKAIAKINETDTVAELLKLIPELDELQKDQKRIAQQLVELLLERSPDTLKSHAVELATATESENSQLRLAGFAGLLTAGESKKTAELAESAKDGIANLLNAIPFIPKKKIRNSLHSTVLDALKHKNENIRLAAVTSLGSLDADPAKDFVSVSPLVTNPKLRRAAIKTLLRVPRKNRNEKSASELANFLVDHAEKTPPADRTSDEFIEAMQLADQVMALIPKDKSKAFRKRLNEVIVRVVLIHTVEEEMRYDIPWFAVEAGRDVQVIVKNEDLMAHNLVITLPDALQEVALDGAALGPKIGASGLQYVPKSDKVIVATEMIQAEKQGRITFTAPTEPGEYPYVCTFPGHWMRMYGVMVVVKDLAEFQRNPTEPKDPVGSNRPFVKAWSVEDLEGKIDNGIRGRTAKIGKKIFNEATCAQCHLVAGEGKAVGPELTDVWSRYKGESTGILREILDPSHKIDPKYIVRKVITFDGRVVSGIVMAEDKDSISILPNPESPEPTVIQQDDIDDMVKSSVSIMPKALMDRFTEDEIMELLGYLKSVDPN